jgi:hypothetical protein
MTVMSDLSAFQNFSASSVSFDMVAPLCSMTNEAVMPLFPAGELAFEFLG